MKRSVHYTTGYRIWSTPDKETGARRVLFGPNDPITREEAERLGIVDFIESGVEPGGLGLYVDQVPAVPGKRETTARTGPAETTAPRSRYEDYTTAELLEIAAGREGRVPVTTKSKKAEIVAALEADDAAQAAAGGEETAA